MAHSPSSASPQLNHSSQDVAIHMISAAARILLMLGTAILVGEVAAGPAKRLIEGRRHQRVAAAEATEAAT